MKNIVDNEGKIGEVKRKLKKKEQNPQQVLNSQDQKLDNKDEILKVYARYKELFKIRSVENMEEEEMDGKIYKKFQEIITEGKDDRDIITTAEIRKAIKRMKKKQEPRITGKQNG